MIWKILTFLQYTIIKLLLLVLRKLFRKATAYEY